MISKIFSITLIIALFISCKAQVKISEKSVSKENSSLNVSEIKFILHESVRRLLFQKASILVLNNLYDFYSDEDINCNSKNLEILVSDKINNTWLNKYLDKSKIKNVIESTDIFLSMQYHFQPKIYLSSIKDHGNTFTNSKVGYLEFSNIVENVDGNYFVNSILNYKIACDSTVNIWSSIIYTFEIERCSSGFLRFKRVIIGDGEDAPSSLGPIPTIKTLTDTEDCR